MSEKLIEVIYYGYEGRKITNALYNDSDLDKHLAELLYKISNNFIQQSIQGRKDK